MTSERVEHAFSSSFHNTSYQRLGPGMIRLLLLQPGEPNDELVLNILTFPATDVKGLYEALSYEWGREHDNVNAALLGWDQSYALLSSGCGSSGANGVGRCSLSITRNLKNALKALRPREGGRSLWIDQLCINQNDVEEKSEQVKMMGKIYSGAGRVLAWLSQEIFESTTFCRDFKAIQPVLYEVDDTVFQIEPRSEFERNEPENIFPVELKEKWEALSDDVWHSVVLLLSSSYWRRVWIIQEIIEADKAFILCSGGELLHFDLITLFIAISTLVPHPEFVEPVLFRAPAVALRNIARLRTFLTNEDEIRSEKATLVDLLIETTTCQATDARDKIYAILGLLHFDHHCLPTSITPNYTRSFVDILSTAFAEELVDQSRLLTLRLCNSSRPVNRELPSWTTDVSAAKFVIRGLDSLAYHYDAHGQTTPDIHRTPSVRALRFKVRKLGRIARIHLTYNVLAVNWSTSHMKSPDAVTLITASQVEPLFRILQEWMIVVFTQRSLTSTAQLPSKLVWPWIYEFTQLMARHILCDISIDEKDVATEEDITKIRGILFKLTSSNTPEVAQDDMVTLFSTLTRAREMSPCIFDLKISQNLDIEQKVREYTTLCPQETFTVDDFVSGNFVMPQLGWVPPGALVDDEVCILHGFPIPMIIREVDEGNYIFVGPAYVMDIMKGEAFDHDDVFTDEFITVI